MQKHRTGHRILIVRVVANLVTSMALGFIRLYKRLISPFLPPACRFSPTCSTYMSQAITEHGLLKGGALGVKRLCKCHPFHEGGMDPVPLREVVEDPIVETAR